MHRRGALVGLVVLAVGGLAACTEDAPEPQPSVTATRELQASPTLSPEPTVDPTHAMSASAFDATVPPEAPRALAGPPSKKSAGAVARYFMALSPYTQATGDLTAWNKLTGEACDYCASARGIVEDLVARGERGEGGEIVITDTQVSDHRANEYAVLLRLRQAPARTVDSAGIVVEDYPDTIDVSADMLLVWAGGEWRIDSVVVDVHGRD